MVINYLKITFRNLRQQKVYSLINILGLSIGMTLCILIVLFVQNELSFDTFFQKADRIYRVVAIEEFNDRITHYKRVGPGVATRLREDFPNAVENTVRLMPVGEVWIKIGDKW